MEARDIILRPVITEASTAAMDAKRYTFDVDLRATKTQVKNAVEEIFDVKVVKVDLENNVLLIKGNVPGANKSYVTIKNSVKANTKKSLSKQHNN